MPSPEGRHELEERYRAALNARQSEYRLAKEGVVRASEDLRIGAIPHADGNQAYRNALALEAFTLRQYRQALSAFMSIVLHGKEPDEPV